MHTAARLPEKRNLLWINMQSYSTTGQVYRDTIPIEIYKMCSSLLKRHGRLERFVVWSEMFDALPIYFFSDELYHMMLCWTGCYTVPFDILYTVELFHETLSHLIFFRIYLSDATVNHSTVTLSYTLRSDVIFCQSSVKVSAARESAVGFDIGYELL